MSKFIDETGHKYGRLTVLNRTSRRNKSGNVKWECICECGNKIAVDRYSITSGNTKSCGCLRLEKTLLPKGKSAFHRYLKRMKKDAQRRLYEWFLGDGQVWGITQRDCFYCGRIPKPFAREREVNGDFIGNGIDRVDNEFGYYMWNVVPCCGPCNYAKRAMSAMDYIKLCKSVTNHCEKYLPEVLNV